MTTSRANPAAIIVPILVVIAVTIGLLAVFIYMRRARIRRHIDTQLQGNYFVLRPLDMYDTSHSIVFTVGIEQNNNIAILSI